MKCPVCSVDLVMTAREQIEIDYCPQCRGVWLDRGELDKLIERATATSRPPVRQHDDDSDYDDDNRRNYDEHRKPQQPYHQPRKKESFWSNLFDFD